MAETRSNMPALGTPASDFHLPDTVSGKTISLQSFAGKKALLVMFLSRHCPFVQHIKQEIARLGQDYGKRGVGMVAISANDIANYPDDAPERLKEMAEQSGFTFPFCYDESQATARAYAGACTPDFFLFDDKRKLVYRGQLDDSRPGKFKPDHRPRSARRARCRFGGQAGLDGSKAQHRLQHQMEIRKRTQVGSCAGRRPTPPFMTLRRTQAYENRESFPSSHERHAAPPARAAKCVSFVAACGFERGIFIAGPQEAYGAVRPNRARHTSDPDVHDYWIFTTSFVVPVFPLASEARRLIKCSPGVRSGVTTWKSSSRRIGDAVGRENQEPIAAVDGEFPAGNAAGADSWRETVPPPVCR